MKNSTNQTKRIIISLMLIISCLILYKCSKHQESIIYEGIGIDDIKLDSLTINDVLPKYGNEYKVIEWGEYSYEYSYSNLGISFWFKQTDINKEIISISVYPNKYMGITSKGLKISKETTLQDIIEVYGKPEWTYHVDDLDTNAKFEDLGIYFMFQKIKEEEEVEEDGENDLYLNKHPIEVVIGKVGTEY